MLCTKENISDLARLGLFRYSGDVFDLEKFIASMSQYRLFDCSQEGRSFNADAEDLAEGGLGWQFFAINDVLRANGAGFDAVSLSHDDEVNDTVLVLDKERYAIGWSSGNAWEHCSNSFFSIVNRRLRKAGSRESAYALWPYENSQTCVFLTPELHAYVMRHELCRSLRLIE